RKRVVVERSSARQADNVSIFAAPNTTSARSSQTRDTFGTPTSYILERQYLTGTLLKHNLFHGHEGWTIKFTTESITHGYSDAFAGSGESAAALLVHNILSVPDNSIVLLDEPETSLHPRAQTRLMEFIAHYTARKSLQVVMATHSSHLAERLPQSAIRVMELNSLGRVAISTSHSAREALHEIGDTNANKTVIVEDERAKHIVLSELKCASPRAANDIRVVVRDGGTSRIFRDIQAYANANRSDIFVVFDGDHRPDFDMPSPNDLPSGKSSLVKLIKKITSGPNEKGPDLNFVDSADCIRFLLFYKRFVRFLPGSTPEELVWNDQSAGVLLESFSSDPALLDAVRKLTDHKKRLVKLAECVPGVEASAVFQILVAHFLKDDSPERQQLRTLILEMRES
ncbi:MAG: AAA family ATPase, partial [Fuerstiella sp.]